jgi:hypothetical protein
MCDLYLNSDHVMKREQYRDLIREANHYRLIKAVAVSEVEGVRKGARARHKGVIGLARRLVRCMPLSPAQI